MKKIGLITLFGKGQRTNYGNLLQNYAVQEVLRNIGYSVETIKETSAYLKSENKLSFKIKVKGFIRDILNIRYKNLQTERVIAFSNFEKQFISKSKFLVNKKNVPSNLCDSYDYFITGSDQVWNPYYNYRSPVYFLSFCKRNKRISFSPSFGISDLPSNIKNQYIKYLNGFEYISVREESGAQIVKELTGRKVSVLIDPTLMLSKEEWNNISNKPKVIPQKEYVLVYFLGKIDYEVRLYLSNLSEQYNLEIINIFDMKQKNFYISSPSEFIWLLDHSKLVFTDSFHGSVFSIIYKKPFIVFDRKSNLNMNSRIETLLSKFNLLSRKSSKIDINQVLEINYSESYSILENERNKVYDFLKDSLNQ